MKNSIFALLAAITVLFGATACSQNEPVIGMNTTARQTEATAVETNAPEAAETEAPEAAETKAPEAIQVERQASESPLPEYSEEVEGVTITLKNFRISNGEYIYVADPGHVFLQPEFEIVNNSVNGTSIGMIFTWFVDEVAVPEDGRATQSAEGELLGNTLAFGQTKTGSVGVQVPEDWETLLIRFTPHASGDSASIVIDRADLP